ncbi:MAG: hypothetical protein Q8927_08595 [Bacteroidota bacterium]|nr:hypothetical protein [Bacteroidota bacterium]MDP4245492.1 hypothetical protein [Bacteroidota bacterium]MDP4253695.1 hypothetical protein [Bacteroidota bacterium]MDP4259979.1 hypothetical protein [Bacteroidota bacterium]
MPGAIPRISSSHALDLIQQGLPLINCYIEGDINLKKNEEKLVYPIFFENCIIENLISSAIDFKHSLTLIGSTVLKCSFHSAYFFDGLTLDNCSFKSYLEFEAGGHNNRPFLIKNSNFSEFVNFFDCWFHSDVIIFNNHFEGGTNLMGNRNQIGGVEFVVSPFIQNNTGRIDADGDGGRPVNIINLLRFK